jgi:hypothetical protein
MTRVVGWFTYAPMTGVSHGFPTTKPERATRPGDDTADQQADDHD